MSHVQRNGKEHYELLEAFERFYKLKNPSRVKDEAFIRQGYVYDNGEINTLFVAFRMGYTYGKLIAEQEIAP